MKMKRKFLSLTHYLSLNLTIETNFTKILYAAYVEDSSNEQLFNYNNKVECSRPSLPCIDYH